MRTVTFLLQTPRRSIGLVSHILDGYDGLAHVYTLNAAAGLLVMQVPEGRRAEAESLLDELEQELELRRLPADTAPESVELPEEWKRRRRLRPSARSRRKRRRRRSQD